MRADIVVQVFSRFISSRLSFDFSTTTETCQYESPLLEPELSGSWL